MEDLPIEVEPRDSEGRRPNVTFGSSRRIKVFAVVASITVFIGAAVVLARHDAHKTASPVRQAPTTVLLPSTIPVGIATSIGSCRGDNSGPIPFRPTYLPDGWDAGEPVKWVWASTDRASVSGVIEVHRGFDPLTPATASTIVVLGSRARIGPTSDGFAVLFTVGNYGYLCDQWTLAAHPETTLDMLRSVAEHLTTFGVGEQTIDCWEGSAVQGPIPPPDYSIILGVVALPTGRALQANPDSLEDGTSALFAKDGLLFKMGTAFDLSVSSEWTGRLAMGWGSPATPLRDVHVPVCTPTGAQTAWVDLGGGYLLRSPACVTVIVTVGAAQEPVQIGIGAPCPGQAPP